MALMLTLDAAWLVLQGALQQESPQWLGIRFTSCFELIQIPWNLLECLLLFTKHLKSKCISRRLFRCCWSVLCLLLFLTLDDQDPARRSHILGCKIGLTHRQFQIMTKEL